METISMAFGNCTQCGRVHVKKKTQKCFQKKESVLGSFNLSKKNIDIKCIKIIFYSESGRFHIHGSNCLKYFQQRKEDFTPMKTT